MKHYLPILLLVAWCGQVLAQKNAPKTFEDLMRTHQTQTEELVKAGDAVTAANLAYSSTVRSALGDQVYAGDLAVQADWMANVLPTLVNTMTDPKQRDQRIDQFVNTFSETFGLSSQSRKAIQKDLKAYAKACENYASAYYQMSGMMSDGAPAPAPPPPPPPPPAQQQH